MAGLPVAPGCLERKESFKIGTDGGVKISIEYRGEEKEWQTSDAMPSPKSGWNVERSVEKKGNDDVQVLKAEREFAPGEALPKSYASKEDANADLALSFPTSVRVERRDGAKFIHFRRVYAPRGWASVQYWKDVAINGELKGLADKRLEELTGEERAKMLKGFAWVEARRQIEFLSAAIHEAFPELSQDRWLLARQAVLNTYEEIDFDRLVEVLEQSPPEDRDARLEKESESILNRAFGAMKQGLRTEGGLNDAQMAEFNKAYERAKLSHAITEQVGGHLFQVEVEMPGRIVAHNADKVDSDNGTAVWEFSGEAFRDRPWEIMITSRVQDE